jgi:hypothetical protein
LESLYSTLINDEAMIKFTDGLSTAVDLVNNIVSGLGGLPGILSMAGSILMKVF